MKIATHNSATGEKGSGIVSILMAPFAKCQSKTLRGQYEAGCRMFDIRVVEKDGEYYCAHGPWRTKRTALDILGEINGYEQRCFVSLTYEGLLRSEDEKNNFLTFALRMKTLNPNIKWGPVAVKYTNEGVSVDWQTIMPAGEWFRNRQGFLPLDGSTWHTYLPIPWLWAKLYPKMRRFSTYQFTFVDFL